MKISTRLVLLFVGITFISTVFVALLTTEGARMMVRDAIVINYQDNASEGASTIDILLRERIHEAQLLAGRADVLAALREANRRYQGQSEAVIAASIHAIDEQWIASRGKNTTADQVRGSELANFLRGWTKQEPKRYGEIFVTDRRGAAVGMTGKLSDYAQADEQWWLEGFADGRGAIFLDDRGMDETTNSLVIGVVVPVHDGDQVIGLLKINYNIDILFALPLADRLPEGGRTFLARSNGQVITVSGEGATPELNTSEIATMGAHRAGWVETQSSTGLQLRAFAPVLLTIHSRVHTIGERPGISGEHWEATGWYVFLDVHSDKAFSSLTTLQQMAIIVTLIALLMAGLVALATARSLSRPLQILCEGAGRIADGDLGFRLRVETSDEVGKLALAFNKMAKSLESQMSELRSSEERLRLMTDSVKDYAIIMLDSDGQVYSWNEGAQRLSGYGFKDVIGHPVAIFFTPEDIAAGKPVQLLEIAMRKGRVEDEGWRLRKDGTRFYANMLLTAMRDPSGELIGFANITHDITKRKAAEDALRESNERYDLAVKGSNDGLWDWNILTNQLYLAPRFKEILGYRDHEMANEFEAWESCLHPDDRAATLAALDAHLKNGTPYDVEYRLYHKSGVYIWTRARGQVLRNKKGEPLRMAGSISDITQNKVAEEEILRLNTSLEQQVMERTAELQGANKELESFAYAIAHDLRAPLRAMTGFSQALMEDYAESLDAEARIYLDQISIGSLRMGELVDGLLTLSRSTRGELQRDEVNLSDLSERLLMEMAKMEPERQVSWEIEPGLIARGDGRMLEAVMRNLLGNAWKYTAATLQAKIGVYSEMRNDKQLFCVSDNGAGFDMAHAGKLFQPFQRLHRQEEFVGIGIGLATVQRIVHRHGGEIQAEAASGKGALFCFTLGSLKGQTPDETVINKIEIANTEELK